MFVYKRMHVLIICFVFYFFCTHSIYFNMHFCFCFFFYLIKNYIFNCILKSKTVQLLCHKLSKFWIFTNIFFFFSRRGVVCSVLAY